MGLLEKATKLATTAKGQYDELRATRDEAAVKPVAVTPLSDHERDVLQHALRHGAPDPAALCSRAEASHVLGVELGEGRLTYDDSQVGLEYAAAGRRQDRWSVSVGAWHGDADGFFPAEQYAFIAEHVEGEPLDGLGEAAVWDGERLYVLAAPLLFQVEVRTPAGGGHRPEAEAVARRVLARVAS
ncbi:hypothetical protein Q5424_19945 [Conexibacter sp. JD483]|uniref:hypothetical protein n=1 Tax=unclassified Conexibacter TaxID=2627773 RepID=UPI002715CF3D|nr:MULTISPECIES: hypothetical protein [unclassified Conexibacter]MDO8188768.1 hypothetical protein [Conexibacter sp. CPCC 205706]MDO8201721.1 hypothetical protein [Conexibacter sp. CPCC 205762]MDR9371382.1 hypothetical protein [Conexibacter sp. JD483]